MAGDNTDLIVAISYSLPHLISASSGVVFAGYLTLLYINIYKWSAEEFGKVYSLQFLGVSISQFLLVLLFQFVFVTLDEVAGLRNCKISQLITIFIHASTFISHLVTLFFLVLLPILKEKYNDRIKNLDNNKDDVQQSLAWKFFNTRWYFYTIGLLSLGTGIGYGSYEIHDRLIPTYIVKDTSNLSSTNDLIRGLSILLTVLFILFLTKLFKEKYPDYMPYLTISTILLILLIPVSVIFYIFTQKSISGSPDDIPDVVPATANLDYPVLVSLLVLETISATLYLTCPIIIQYISTNFLDDDADFRINASTFYLVFFFLGSVFYKAFAQIVSLPKKTVSYMCLACYSIAYLLVLPHRYSWNKKGFLYYVIIAVHNIFIMVGFINTNIMITNQMADDNHKKYRWLIQGCYYFILKAYLFFILKYIYALYEKGKRTKLDDSNASSNPSVDDEDENAEEKKEEPSQSKWNFSNLFILVFLVCQVAGAIATTLYKEHIFKK